MKIESRVKTRALVVKEKFPARHQTPEQVFSRKPFFRRVIGLLSFGEQRGQARDFLRGWRATQAKKKNLLKNRTRARIGIQNLGDSTLFTPKFSVQRFAIAEVQDLNHTRFVRSFTFASDVACVAAKGFQEVGLHCGVVQFQRTCPLRIEIRLRNICPRKENLIELRGHIGHV